MLYNLRNFNAGIYLRISKDEIGKEESESITNQRKIIYDYLKRNPDFVVCKEYIDDGYSGSNFNRPGFKEMLADIDKGKVNFVITKNLARFGRNYIESGEYLQKIFPDKMVRFVAVLDNYDNFVDSVESDFLPLKSVFNEKHCKDTSVALKKSKRRKMQEGVYCCTTPPYGYKKDPENNLHLIIDDESSKVVKKIFEMRAEGKQLKEIARYLTAKGYKTPAVYSNIKTYKNKPNINIWKTKTICTILTNEIYLGTVVRGKTQTISYKSKKRFDIRREDRIKVENMHEAIVSKELFNKAYSQSTKPSPYKRKEGKPSLLKNLVYCSNCGAKMRRRTECANSRFYCSRNTSSDILCNHKEGIVNSWLENIVISKIKEMAENYINNTSIDNVLLKALNEKTAIYNSEKKEIENEIKKITKFIYNVYNSKLNNKSQDEDENILEYNRLNKLRLEKRKELENIEHKIEEERKFITCELNKNEILLEVKTLLTEELTNEILSKFIKRIEVDKNSVLIKYNFTSEYQICKIA